MNKTMDNDYSSYSREDLKDEIERLKAELAALKPVPVVEVVTYDYWDLSNTFTKNPYGKGRLKITFTDGKLTACEVLK